MEKKVNKKEIEEAKKLMFEIDETNRKFEKALKTKICPDCNSKMTILSDGVECKKCKKIYQDGGELDLSKKIEHPILQREITKKQMEEGIELPNAVEYEGKVYTPVYPTFLTLNGKYYYSFQIRPQTIGEKISWWFKKRGKKD